MKFFLHTVSSVACFLSLTQHTSSTPLPRANHEIHVDLIDSIFQIPIQTLNAVGNLLKNVHSAKRNFLSINVHIDKPDNGYNPSTAKPARPSYPSSKPDTTSPASGFPDYQPDYNPVLPGSSVRPASGVTVGLNFPDSRPDSPSTPEVNESSSPSYGTTSGEATFVTDLQGVSSSSAPPSYRPSQVSSYKPSEPTYDRVPPAPAVQPPYTRSPVAQPLSLDGGSGFNFEKPGVREKNFKEYVQKKLAEKNLQDNRISHTF